MALRKYQPTSPGRRQGTVSDYADVTSLKPYKGLTVAKRSSGGRNNVGRITCRHMGGGHRRRYRIIDFKRNKDGIAATVKTIEYDPNRSARIALLQYADGERRYILAPVGLEVGGTVISGAKVEPRVGNAMPIRGIPVGVMLHSVELTLGRGAQLGRSAGTSVQLVAKEGEYAHLVLPSGEMRKVHLNCRATIGQIGNIEYNNISIGKAGRNRWRGIRPTVRGMTMNPCDHPMGGGEGRSKSGHEPCSPTGVLSKGGKTRQRKKASSAFIIRRRKKRRR